MPSIVAFGAASQKSGAPSPLMSPAEPQDANSTPVRVAAFTTNAAFSLPIALLESTLRRVAVLPLPEVLLTLLAVSRSGLPSRSRSPTLQKNGRSVPDAGMLTLVVGVLATKVPCGVIG